MSESFKEKMVQMMLAQQMALQESMMKRVLAGSRPVNNPPLNEPRRTSAPRGQNMAPSRNQLLQQQYYGGQPRYQQPQRQQQQQYQTPTEPVAIALPAAFAIMAPYQEAERLNIPKDRTVVEREEGANIDWDGPAGGNWWKKDRIAIKLRHIFYVSWFIGNLKAANAANGKIYDTEKTFDEVFLFEISIREIMSALHKIYLDPDSEMHRLLKQLIKAENLSAALAGPGRPNFLPGFQELVFLLENIVYQMTYIQPPTGVLGTNKRSQLNNLIKEGQLFPQGEFWDIEKKHMHFDYTGRTTRIGNREGALLLTMTFYARGLIWTLLLNPIEYGLLKGEVTSTAFSNLKLMASLLILVYRRYLLPRAPRLTIPEAPKEIAHLLYPDETLKQLFETVENSIFFCDGLLREWSGAYIRRLKAE